VHYACIRAIALNPSAIVKRERMARVLSSASRVIATRKQNRLLAETRRRGDAETRRRSTQSRPIDPTLILSAHGDIRATQGDCLRACRSFLPDVSHISVRSSASSYRGASSRVLATPAFRPRFRFFSTLGPGLDALR